MSITPPATPGLMDNLKGATDIMLGRESGLQRMDLSAHGFAWSFAGLLLALFVDISALSVIYNTEIATDEPASVTKIGFTTGKLFARGLAYLAAMTALYLLCRGPEEQARFPTSVIAHNWAAPVVSLALLPWAVMSSVSLASQTPETVGSFWIAAGLAIMSLLILAGVRLIRISLAVSLSKACLFFVITTAISLVCLYGIERLMGVENLAV